MKKTPIQGNDPLDKWREQLRRGGLEIIRYLQEATDLVVTEGTIYPILGRLTRSGIVEAEWISGETPHPRKYYRLSNKGRDSLDEMLDHWNSYRSKIDHLVKTAGRMES